MNARLVGRRIRWTHLACVSACFLAGACAEPTTVDPKLVPEASVDSGPDVTDADPDADADATGGTGGTGGSGGTGGAGGSGGTGGVADASGDAIDGAADRRGDAADALGDVSSDPAADAPVVDTSTPPEAATDARDTISEPPAQDTGGRDGASDASGDRG